MPLSPLDGNQISVIAFYNVRDQGLDEIDPEETTSAMDTSEVYSNGVDGTIIWTYAGNNHNKSRAFRCRVKDDGWVMVYADRTADVSLGEESPPNGPWDLVRLWADPDNGGIGTTQNVLERLVNQLVSALSNSGGLAYSASDVGLYHFEASGASTISIREHSAQGASGTDDMGVTPSSTTTLHAYYVFGGASSSDPATVYHDPDGSNIVLANGSGGHSWGALDALAEGTVEAGTTTIERHDGLSNDFASSKATAMAFWS